MKVCEYHWTEISMVLLVILFKRTGRIVTILHIKRKPIKIISVACYSLRRTRPVTTTKWSIFTQIPGKQETFYH
jgi:hypothetical protein